MKRRSYVLAPPSSEEEVSDDEVKSKIELAHPASDEGKSGSGSDEDINDPQDEPEEMDQVVEVKPKKKKSGIIYVSSIPRHMNVAILRELFSEFGAVGRIFLEPDKKFMANKKKKKSKKPLAMHFTEGWVEFESKRVAKWVVENINAKPITKKKNSRFCDVLWTLKYLPRFKWVHLSERLTYERAVYRQKLQVEISQARKEANFFQENLDRGEKFKKKQKKMQKEMVVKGQ